MTLLRIIREIDRSLKRAERERIRSLKAEEREKIKRWKAEERERVQLEKEANRQRKALEREKLKLQREALAAQRGQEKHFKQMTKFRLEGLKQKEASTFEERSRKRDQAKWKILREAIK